MSEGFVDPIGYYKQVSRFHGKFPQMPNISFNMLIKFRLRKVKPSALVAQLEIIYSEGILGIDAASAGFKDITIASQFNQPLKHASGS